MRFAPLLALFIITPFLALASFDQTQKNKVAQEKNADLSGIWHVSGKEGDQPYAGIAIFIKKADGIYRYDAITQGHHSTGIALVKGKTVSISWRFVADPKAYAVSQFELTDAKTLKGFWVSPGNEEPHPETMRWLRSEEDPEV